MQEENKPTQINVSLQQRLRLMLIALLVGGACGGIVGLALGGVTAVLAELVEGIATVAFGAALAGGAIGSFVGLLAGLITEPDNRV